MTLIITKHISLEKEYIEKITPYIVKHKGNFSAAIKEIINRAENYKSIENSVENYAIRGKLIRKHISLDHECLLKMEPYVEKHKGNFSAAIREIINREGNAVNNMIS